MRRGVMLAAGLGAILSVSAGPALGASRDSASTQAFIHLADGYVKAALGSEGAERAAVNAFVSKVGAACPNSLPATVPGSGTVALAIVRLGEEASIEVELAALGPIKAATGSYTQRFARLRWSNPKIAAANAASERARHAALSLNRPNLCTDIAATVSDKFARVPADVTRFLTQVSDATAPGGNAAPTLETVLDMLKPYTTAAQARSVAHLVAQESSVQQAGETIAGTAYTRLITTLTT
jgi:hypothetical protein